MFANLKVKQVNNRLSPDAAKRRARQILRDSAASFDQNLFDPRTLVGVANVIKSSVVTATDFAREVYIPKMMCDKIERYRASSQNLQKPLFVLSGPQDHHSRAIACLTILEYIPK